MSAWSCLLDSFAISFEISKIQLIKLLGHDGSEIIWYDQPEPLRRRGFHPQEFIRIGYSLGYAVVCFQTESLMHPVEYEEPIILKYDLEPIYNDCNGVFTGLCKLTNQRHAFAWKDRKAIDHIHRTFTNFEIDEFYAVFKIS